MPFKAAGELLLFWAPVIPLGILLIDSLYPQPSPHPNPAKATILVYGTYFYGQTISDTSISIRLLIPVHSQETSPFDLSLQGSWVEVKVQTSPLMEYLIHPRIHPGLEEWGGLTSNGVFFWKQRDGSSFLEVDGELVAMEATLGWWGRRLVGYGQRRERGWVPHAPGAPRCSGHEEKRITCAFLVPADPPGVPDGGLPIVCH